MKQMTFKIRRKLCKLLGGVLYSDIASVPNILTEHRIVKYDKVAAMHYVDTLRPRMPDNVYKDVLMHNLIQHIKPYIVFTEEKDLYRPYTINMRAELWVGKND
jgi:hypothetical protein